MNIKPIYLYFYSAAFIFLVFIYFSYKKIQKRRCILYIIASSRIIYRTIMMMVVWWYKMLMTIILFFFFSSLLFGLLYMLPFFFFFYIFFSFSIYFGVCLKVRPCLVSYYIGIICMVYAYLTYILCKRSV